MYIYRAVIAPKIRDDSIGIRILGPLKEAIPYYQRWGYTDFINDKGLQAIVLERPRGE